jgi:hypothetical protein
LIKVIEAVLPHSEPSGGDVDRYAERLELFILEPQMLDEKYSAKT